SVLISGAFFASGTAGVGVAAACASGEVSGAFGVSVVVEAGCMICSSFFFNPKRLLKSIFDFFYPFTSFDFG
ncbi:MAG TPA: hypothetical protein VN653_11905, partial [Anaerolineales bacterium]|nr:hypothetical protein [Anaerolineales bacterium]